MERKLATVLFVDLVGSTALVSGSDPEVVRRRVTRFFEQVSRCVTTHGGIVEKFAGDAVMAAFGIPRAHEDDAERAIRAGLAIMDAVRELELEARGGVESGEVVADDGDSTFATGEAVNLAARLQQAAGTDELYVGPAAHRLTLDRIEFEDVGPLEVKGRSEPIWAWRAVHAVDGEPSARRNVGAPLVGRETELELLENTFDRAVRNRRAHVFTVFGEPGIGKSRLAREFVEGLEGATVLAGRCLPYGEGITYWPLAEMVKAAAGISDDDPVDEAVGKLLVCCEDEAVADLLGLASGVLEAVEGDRSQQEIAWAAREWAERMAQEQPLVLAFEDIHWAEDPLLELVEHLAEWVREAPLLIICLARPELLDVRPGWGGGRLRATAIELEPLAPADSEELVDALLDGELPADVRAAVLAKTEGNPLFVEETVRMLAECEDAPSSEFAERIPDTLQALIAARIDRLPIEERLLLQRASVVGRIFWAGAVAHLSPELEESEPALERLLLRDFITRESRSTISDETAYRFKHVLIREVAYSGLSKSARADLHASFAGWLGEEAGEELLEIRAYHLDQACALLAELDGAPPAELAEEAAAALEQAGRRALAREANRSARRLLVRAVELDSTLERRYQAARAAWRLTDLPAVSAEMEGIREAARAVGDRRIEARALMALADVALYRDADVPRAQELGDFALEVIDPADDVARYDALSLLSTIAWWKGDLTSVERLSQEMLALAQKLGRNDLESGATIELASVHEARLDDEAAAPLLARALELAEASGSIDARAWALRSCGERLLRLGDLDQAETMLAEARDLFAEAGAVAQQARSLNILAKLRWSRDDRTGAERLFREAIRLLKSVGDRGILVESQRMLAQVLLEQGKLEEAERYALESRETVGMEDEASRATTRMALGLVRAAQARDEEAEALLREAVEILGETEYRRHQLEPLGAFAQFLRVRGRADEAAALEERRSELLSPPERTAKIA